MAEIVEQLLEDAARGGPLVLLGAAFALAFAETGLFTDLLVPGEIGMVVVGAVTTRAGVDLWWVVLAAAVGATLGDSFGWWVGARFGRRLLHRFPRLERKLEPSLGRAEDYFATGGGPVIFWGRFVGFLRGVVAFVAGTSGMPYRRFLPWNVAASVCWTSSVISAGFLFGRNVDVVLGEIGLALGVAIVAVGLTIWLLRRRSNGGSTTRTEAGSMP